MEQIRNVLASVHGPGPVPTQELKQLMVDIGMSEADASHAMQLLDPQPCGEVEQETLYTWMYGEAASKPKTVGPPSTTLEQVEGSPSTETKDFSMRAVTVGNIFELFTERCGTIYSDEADDKHMLKPICKPYKLAQMVAEENLKRLKKKTEEKLGDSDWQVRPLRTDLYAVNELIIKKVTKGVSMSEHWHPGGLAVHYFISHYWGEDFGEFVQSLLRFALFEVRRLSPNLNGDEIWSQALSLQLYICAFSNNQHNIKDELGGSFPEATPFFVAMQKAERVILNLDTQISALQRAWCVFEFHLTHAQDKLFFLNTYLGPLSTLSLESQENLNWLDHMFEMLRLVDLTQAQASKPEDKEMIMKRVEEGGGVKVLHYTLKGRISTAVLPMLAKASKLKQVQTALEHRADVNTMDNNGLSALTYAQANAACDPTGEAAKVNALCRTYSQANTASDPTGEAAKAIVELLKEYGADESHMEPAVELVKMFDKDSPENRQRAISEVRKYVERKALDAMAYHAKALARAQHQHWQREATDQATKLRNDDATAKALALEGLVKTGRAALRHVTPIVDSLTEMVSDKDGVVCKGAVQALHSLGPNAAHLAMPHLMQFLPTSVAGKIKNVSAASQVTEVMHVLQNFNVAIPRAFEGQVSAAARQLDQGGTQAVGLYYGCDTHFNIRQRLFPVPPHWDWRPDVINARPFRRQGSRSTLRRDRSLHRVQSEPSSPSSSPFKRAREVAGKQVKFYQLSPCVDKKHLDELLPKEAKVVHLALDLRHSAAAGEMQLGCLEHTLQVAERAQQELVVDLDFCAWVTLSHVKTLLCCESGCLQRLAHLYLTAGGVQDLKDDTLLGLVQALPDDAKLKSMKLALGSSVGDVFTDGGVCSFAETLREKIRGWRYLTSLAISVGSGAENIPAGALAPLVDIKDGLEEVHLGLPASTAISDELFRAVSGGGAASGQQSPLPDVDAIRLPATLHALSFDFGASKEITDAGVKALINRMASNGPTLRHFGLNLHAAHKLSDEVLHLLAGLVMQKKMTELRLDLGFADLMDQGLTALANSLLESEVGFKVLTIDARQSARLTWSSMELLGKAVYLARASLTRLSLNFCSFGANENFSIRDNYDISTLLMGTSDPAGFEKLESLHLNFSQCISISDAGLRKLCAALPPKLDLLDLDFSFNDALTEETLITFGDAIRKLPDLTHFSLNIMAAATVTDAGVVKLADSLSHLSKLRHFSLNLHNAHDLSNEAVEKLAEAMKKTKYLEALVLDFFQSSSITNVKILADSLRTLDYLASVVVHVAGETKRGIEELKQELRIAKRFEANMNYTPSEEQQRLAADIVTTLGRQTLWDSSSSSKMVLDMRTVFRRNNAKQYKNRRSIGRGSRQIIFFTDLMPDDCMAIMQLLHLKAKESVDLAIVFCADFAQGKDEERVFELKLFIMVQMLGINLDLYVLNCTDRSGPEAKRKVHSKREKEVDGQQNATMERLCTRVGLHEGDIDLYILAATRGCLENFRNGLEAQATKVSKEQTQKWNWHVTLCSDKNNMGGFLEADKRAVQWLLSRSKDPLLKDICKNSFFGKEGKKHLMLSTFASFVGEKFGDELKKQNELLVAALREYSVLSTALAIKPDEEMLFGPSSGLDAEAQKQFHEIQENYDPHNATKLSEYANQLYNNEILYNLLTPTSRNALQSHRHAGAAAPFGSQVVYLYEWAEQNEKGLVEDAVGIWVPNSDSTTAVKKGSADKDQIRAVQPRLKNPKDEEGLKVLRHALTTGILDSLKDLQEVETHKNHTLDGPGNLCYATPLPYYQKAKDIVKSGKVLTKDTLRSFYPKAMDPPEGGDNEDLLMVVYTDLEPDDTMAIAQLWRWKVEQKKMKRPPIVVFTADFLDKDKGPVFEMKILVAALMLGAVPVYVIPPIEHDTEENRNKLPSEKTQFMQARQTLQDQLATELRTFDGDGKQIDLYLLSPLRGVLADTVHALEDKNAWPLPKATWKVSLYTGAFNMKGLLPEDNGVMRRIVMEMSEGRELVDLAKFPFFGGKECDRIAASFSSFAKEGFATELSTSYPLLASALKLLNDAHNWELIKPQSLFEKAENTKEGKFPEEVTAALPKLTDMYKDASENMDPQHLADYATRIFEDEELFIHVKNFKKSTLQAFAYKACDSPLCDQLVFLFEWLLDKAPSMLSKHTTPGRWQLHCEDDGKKRYTAVKPLGPEGFASDEIRGIQPVLRDPKNKDGLDMMRKALNDYLLLHLAKMEEHNQKRGLGQWQPTD